MEHSLNGEKTYSIWKYGISILKFPKTKIYNNNALLEYKSLVSMLGESP